MCTYAYILYIYIRLTDRQNVLTGPDRPNSYGNGTSCVDAGNAGGPFQFLPACQCLPNLPNLNYPFSYAELCVCTSIYMECMHIGICIIPCSILSICMYVEHSCITIYI